MGHKYFTCLASKRSFHAQLADKGLGTCSSLWSELQHPFNHVSVSAQLCNTYALSAHAAESAKGVAGSRKVGGHQNLYESVCTRHGGWSSGVVYVAGLSPFRKKNRLLQNWLKRNCLKIELVAGRNKVKKCTGRNFS